MEPISAPSPFSISNIRALAFRRGYRVKKLRGKDRFKLVSISTGESIVANEHCEQLEDCFFTRHEVVDYVRSLPIL